MSKEINLEKIIEQFCYITKDEQKDVHSSVQSVKDAMKEVCKQTLELAAKRAITITQEMEDPLTGQEYYSTVIDKQSILDTINQIK